MELVKLVISKIWAFLNLSFTVYGYDFTLFGILVVTVLCGIIGYIIGLLAK